MGHLDNGPAAHGEMSRPAQRSTILRCGHCRTREQHSIALTSTGRSLRPLLCPAYGAHQMAAET